MAYSYYLVSYTKASGEVISTNVYEADEATARAVGSVKLEDYYSISVPAASLTIEEIDTITSDTATTT